MPSQIVIRNGKPVVVGTDSSADLQPTVPENLAPPPKPKPRPKPKGFFEQLGNDIRYEFNQIRKDPVRSLVRGARSVAPEILKPMTGALPFQPSPAIGGLAAMDSAMRMGYSAFQRFGQKKAQADPSAGMFGQALDLSQDVANQVFGGKAPSQMTTAELQRYRMQGDLTLNVGLAGIAPLRFGAFAAKTKLGAAVRGLAAGATNEALSQFLTDNTGGGAIDLINQVAGTKLPGGLGDKAGQLDMIDSALATFGGNVAVGQGVGTALALGGKLFKGSMRRVRNGRLVAEEAEARARLQQGGVIQPKGDDADAFDAGPAVGQATPQKPATFADANAQMEARLGMKPQEPAADAGAPTPAQQIEQLTAGDQQAVADFGKAQPGELPQGDDLSVDPWDPELPELTDVLKTLDEQSPEVIRQLDQAEGSVTEQLQQLQAATPPLEVDPGKRFDLAAAPTDRISQLYMDGAGEAEPWAETLKALEPAELKSLASPVNSPELADRIFTLTGKDWAEQTTADIRLGLESLSKEGKTALTERLRGGKMVPTSEIALDPSRFQYKGGVNDQGQQLGASLSGEEAWNPRAEGTIEVWRDPADQKLYVVNGHNRLALAKELGIPSLMVKEITATKASAARAFGAISNIAEGQGNAFDAAKFIRESGYTTPEQLKAAGMTGERSWAKDGLALSKLPEDLFRAAVNEDISLRKAVIIGESGLPEAKMRTMGAEVRKDPNMPDWELRELGAMNRNTPEVQADQGGFDLGMDFSEGMRLKAQVVRQVQEILRKEQKLFNTAAKGAATLEGKAGNTIDRAGSKAVADEANTALSAFERMKYEAGAVGDRLNQAVQQIGGGDQPAAVARQVVDDLKGTIQKEMDAAMGRPADPDQIDLLAPPEAAAEAAPPPLTARELEAAKMRLVARTAQDGEARPPTTPIPVLSDPPRVTPADAIEDIRMRGGIEEGAPGAQAIDDEMRLLMEQAEQDALARQEAEDGMREMFGYDEKTFEEKKALGMTEGWDDSPAGDMALVERKLATNDQYQDYLGPVPKITPVQEKLLGEVVDPTTAQEMRVGMLELERTPVLLDQLAAAMEGATPAKRRSLKSLADKIKAHYDYVVTEPPAPALKQGAVGMRLEFGDQVLTSTGRETTQFLGESINARSTNSARARRSQQRDQWLLENAAAEAKARGDGFSTTDPAAAEQYLFGQQPAVAPAVLKEMSAPGEPLKFKAEIDIPPAKAEPIDPKRITPADRNLVMDQFRVDPQGIIDDANYKVNAGQWGDTKEDFAAWVGADRPDAKGATVLYEGKSASAAAAAADAYTKKEIARAVGLIEQARAAAKAPVLAEAPIRPEPLRMTESPEQPDFALPEGLTKAAPRYGRFTVAFESDLDRAAYVLQNDAAKPSKSAGAFRAAVEAAGLNPAAVVAHGKQVKAALKAAAKGNTAGEVRLPTQPWADGELASVPQDWVSFDTTTYMRGASGAKIIEKRLRRLIGEVAGDEVAVRFLDTYETVVLPKAWGGDGTKTTLRAGFFRFTDDLIQVNGLRTEFGTELTETAMHEAFHRIQFMALGQKEINVLNGRMARLKVDLGAGTRNIAYLESQALTFQKYARARVEGTDPIAAIVGVDFYGLGRLPTTLEKAATGVVKAFDVVWDFVERMSNLLKGNGFDSVKAIYERASQGALRDSLPEGDIINSTRMGALRKWQGQTATYEQMAVQVSAIDNRIDELRQRAAREGC